ncbi:hypothetical protein RUM43_003463, partial [Polyplax serrata]
MKKIIPDFSGFWVRSQGRKNGLYGNHGSGGIYYPAACSWIIDFLSEREKEE